MEPWPVNQQFVPGSVLSSSGWAAVPRGLPYSQTPVVAVSPAQPTVQPGLVSMSSSTMKVSPSAYIEP